MSLGVPNDRRFPSLQQSIQEDTSPTSYTGLDSFVSTGAAFSFQQVPTNPSTPSKAFATGGPLAPTSSPFAKKAGAAPAINIMNTMQQDGLADLDMDLMTDDNQPHNDGDFDIDLDVGEAKYDDGDIDLDVDVNFNDQMMGFGQENDYQMAGAGQGGGNIAVEEADDVMVDEMGDAHQQQQQQQQDDEMIPDEPNVQGGAVTVVESTSLTVEMSTAPAPSSPLPMDDQSSPVVAYQTLATQTQTQTPTQTQQPFPPSTADTAPFQSHEGPSGNTQVDNSVTPTKPLSPPSHQSSQTQPPTHFSPPPPTQTPQFSPSHNAAPVDTHFSPPVQQPVYNSPPIQRPDDAPHPSQTDLNNIQQQQQPPLPSPSLVGNVTSPLAPPVDAPTENSRNSTPPAPVVPVEENQQEQQEQKDDGEDATEESHEEYRYNQEFENHELDDQDFNNEVDNDNFNHEDDHKNEVAEEVDEPQDEQVQEVDQQGYPADAHHQEADQNGHEAAYEGAEHNNIEDLPEEVRVSQAETAKLEESPEVPQREWAQHPHAVNKVETAHIHHEQGNYQVDVATSIATEVAEEETSHELERGSPTPTDHPAEESHEHAATPPQDGSYEEDAPAEENANDEHVEHADEEYHQEYPSHPIVVLYKDTEYSLYHDEKNNNVANIPQSFILADNTLTGKSFSHTMAALREVMVNELDPNDEIVLKVKDLDLTFEEHNSQNNDITVFHLTDLFLQLSSQDGNDEPGPLYCELQRRPRYLTKLNMLKNHVLAGGGLASLKKDHAPVQDEYASGTDTANEQGPTHDEKEDVETSQHEGDEDLELEEFEKVPEEELLGQDEIQQTEASDKKAEEKDELELSEEEYETLQNADDLEDSVVVGGKYNDAASKDGDQNNQADNDEGEQFDFEDDHQAETGGGEEGDDSLIGFDEELGQRESTGKQNTGQPSASAVNKTAGNKQSEEDDDILDVVQVKSRPLKSKVDDDDDIGEAITVQKSPAKPSVSTRSHHHHKSNSNSKAAPAKPANPAPAKDWIKLGEPYDDDSKDADGDDDDFNFDINDNDVPVKSGNNGSAKHNGGDASLDFYDDNTFEEEGAEFSVYPDLRDSPPIGDHINVAPAGEKRARDEEEGDTIVVNPGFYSASKRRRAS